MDTGIYRDYHRFHRNLATKGNWISYGGYYDDSGIQITSDGEVIIATASTHGSLFFGATDSGESIITTADGDMTIAADGDITITASGGDIVLKDSEANSIFTFNLAEPSFRLIDDADNPDDYVSIATATHGTITITTVDDDLAAADLILNIDGEIDLNSAVGEPINLDTGSGVIQFLKENTDRGQISFATDDVMDIRALSNDELRLTSLGSGSIVLDSSIDITLDADGGNITLQDGGSTYTPTATSDATTKAYVDTRYMFGQTMTYYNKYTDHDQEWLLCNNASFYKLGGTDISIDDEELATLSSANQSIAQTLWFVAPFPMNITFISGNVMDNDLTNHANANYLGIWVVEGWGTAGDTPTYETGVQTFILKYITQDWQSLGGDDRSFGFYDSAPNGGAFNLSAGDAVWVGHMNIRSSTADAATVQMSVWGNYSG